MVTAIAALRLVEQGRVGLQQPLVEILPAEQHPAALTREHTLHHLLSHTSGLANYHDDAATTWDSFVSSWDRIPTYHVRRPADMLPLFADLPAVARPARPTATTTRASSWPGWSSEAASGRPFNDVARETVLQPAGMVDSAFDALDEDPPRLATGYLMTDGPYETWRSNIFSVTASGCPTAG